MNKIKEKCDLIVGVLFLVYYILLLSFSKSVSFKLIFLVAGVVFIGHHFLKNKLSDIQRKYTNKIFGSILTIGITGFIIIQSRIIFYPKNSTSPANYMIILGAGLNGESLSVTLEQRLDKAIEYTKLYDKDIPILVSGGKGDDELVSEASAMKKYLLLNGIEEEQIIVEDQSTSTFENFKYSYEKIKEVSEKPIELLDIKVVTSDFHAFRSNFIAERVGFINLTFYTNKTYTPIIPSMYTRETLAIIKSFIFDRM